MIANPDTLHSLFQSSPLLSPFGRAGGASSFQDVFAPPAAVEPGPAGASDSAALSPLAGLLGRQGGASALFEFNYQAVHAISETRDGNTLTRSEFFSQSFEMKLTVSGDPEAAQSLFDKLQAEFTPEKVADRIAGFATSGFGRLAGADGQDTLTGRGGFRDFIQKSVEKGFADALGMLGPLADPVKDGLDKTLALLKERLDAWAKAGDADVVSESLAPQAESQQ